MVVDVIEEKLQHVLREFYYEVECIIETQDMAPVVDRAVREIREVFER